MITLRMALENKRDFDEAEPIEFETDHHIEVLDKFDFEISPVTTVMESFSTRRNRHRSVATEGISLEQATAGFWVALGVAVAAAVALLMKMIGWFTGGSSGGGGGGGGGSVEAVKAKVPKTAQKAEAIRENYKTVLKYAR